MTKANRSVLFQDSDCFFEQYGSVWMRLSKKAAIEVAQRAAENNLIVVKVEGGIWQSPGFKSQMDCIWDSAADPPTTVKVAANSNRDAANFMTLCAEKVDVFLVTAFPIVNNS